MKISSKPSRVVGKASFALASVAVAASALGACSPQTASHQSTTARHESVVTVTVHAKAPASDPSDGGTIQTGDAMTSPSTSAPARITLAGDHMSTTQVTPVTPPATAVDGVTVPTDGNTDGPTKTVYRSTKGGAALAWGAFGAGFGAAKGGQQTLGQAVRQVMGMANGHS